MNPCRTLFLERSLVRTSRLLGAVLAVVVSVAPASADAISISEISFENLSITARAGTLSFPELWQATAFAQAANSLGQRDEEFERSIGGTAVADAFVTYANALAISSAVDLTGSANSAAEIPGCQPRAASAVGQTGLQNSFVVTGATSPTFVDISVDLSGRQRLRTDACGERAESEIIFSLLLDGLTLASHQSLFEIGPNEAIDVPLARHFDVSVLVNPDTRYALFAGLDAESEAITTVPEPAAVGLLLLGMCQAVARRIRQRRRLP